MVFRHSSSFVGLKLRLVVPDLSFYLSTGLRARRTALTAGEERAGPMKMLARGLELLIGLLGSSSPKQQLDGVVALCKLANKAMTLSPIDAAPPSPTPQVLDFAPVELTQALMDDAKAKQELIEDFTPPFLATTRGFHRIEIEANFMVVLAQLVEEECIRSHPCFPNVIAEIK
ncbi:hypothetical protein RIF29_21508 [Crotalaria pallida]|uniref:Uncharacterized protein n=1 Tax=Crotalaria pallida TaxID=3830 RepID=A0AAN9F348_CROPI